MHLNLPGSSSLDPHPALTKFQIEVATNILTAANTLAGRLQQNHDKYKPDEIETLAKAIEKLTEAAEEAMHVRHVL